MILIASSGCTHNNGDIGELFGMWNVTSIVIDGTVESSYKGNVVLKFQNNVLESQAQYDHHLTNNCYANWDMEGDSLFLILPENEDGDTQYGYVEELHLPWLPLIEMKILNLNGKNAELQYDSDNGVSIRYYMKKIY